MFDLHIINPKRSSKQAGSQTFSSHAQHLITLDFVELDPFMPDRVDARTAGKQVHEKVLGLHRVIRAVGINALVVMGMNHVVDVVFG